MPGDAVVVVQPAQQVEPGLWTFDHRDRDRLRPDATEGAGMSPLPPAERPCAAASEPD